MRAAYLLILPFPPPAIGSIADDFLHIIAREGWGASVSDLQHVASLVSLNHKLLCTLGVSAPKIEEVCTLSAAEVSSSLRRRGSGGMGRGEGAYP